MSDFELLLQQISDPIIRENFRRLKAQVQDLITQGTEGGDTTININNPPAPEVDSPWEKFDTTVNGSSTKVVDLVDLGDFTSVKYIISINSDPNSLTKYYEMGIIRLGSTVSDTVYARVGTGMDLQVQAAVNAGNLELSIVNNEAYNVNVFAAKLVL